MNDAQPAPPVEVDEIDRKILEYLQEDARISNADLARRVHLSPPAVHARIRRLRDLGLIVRFVTLLDREKAGFDMLCFVHVSLQHHQADQVRGVLSRFNELPEILECHHVTGEYDYLLKVLVRNRQHLSRFIGQLTPTPGVGRIYTSMVLNEIKSETRLPL
ncbi:Lrp/AsnC family transcriptional regulator [Sulfidibacter corallicola]|uniref:Lrp/AsnC family transcriptional regulator n=1 Tax=Sulfidibacter corallicola TaxID=2818388 RepID=A0A8A4TG63_SULCO|nr:Lrp/AsnC family transcriptional regulator [Sulfidibacter corallicola]QTD48517.1 Lrp/AsnC family transcriptional regulator [Sulfidibacter corallicola]